MAVLVLMLVPVPVPASASLCMETEWGGKGRHPTFSSARRGGRPDCARGGKGRGNASVRQPGRGGGARDTHRGHGRCSVKASCLRAENEDMSAARAPNVTERLLLKTTAPPSEGLMLSRCGDEGQGLQRGRRHRPWRPGGGAAGHARTRASRPCVPFHAAGSCERMSASLDDYLTRCHDLKLEVRFLTLSLLTCAHGYAPHMGGPLSPVAALDCCASTSVRLSLRPRRPVGPGGLPQMPGGCANTLAPSQNTLAP